MAVLKGLAKSFAKFADEVVETPTSVKTATTAVESTRGRMLFENVLQEASTPNQQTLAIRSYQKNARAINSVIRQRGGITKEFKESPWAVEGENTTFGRLAKVLDDATTQTFDENRALFRGLGLPQDQADQLQPGKIFSSPTYLSFSKAGVKAREFATAGEGVPVLFELRGAKGIKAKDLRNFTDFKEAEVLLARDQKFIIDEVRQAGSVKKVILRPQNQETSPLVMQYRDSPDAPDSNMIVLPLKEGGTIEKPIIEKDPARLLNRIVNKSDDELAEKYPDVDIQQLKQKAQLQLDSME